MELATLLGGVNDGTDRQALKRNLNRLYEEATIISEMFVHLVIKLPNFERLSPIYSIALVPRYTLCG